jgi:hypothetical protein
MLLHAVLGRQASSAPKLWPVRPAIMAGRLTPPRHLTAPRARSRGVKISRPAFQAALQDFLPRSHRWRSESVLSR